MTRYEYHILDLPDPDDLASMEKLFNDLGKDGWELISLDDSLAVFKRRRTGLD